MALGGCHQRIDDLVADLVGEMTWSHDARESTHVAVAAMVEDERVEDVREQASILLQCLRETLCAGLAHSSVRVVQLGEYLLHRDAFTLAGVLERTPNRRDRFVE